MLLLLLVCVVEFQGEKKRKRIERFSFCRMIKSTETKRRIETGLRDRSRLNFIVFVFLNNSTSSTCDRHKTNVLALITYVLVSSFVCLISSVSKRCEEVGDRGCVVVGGKRTDESVSCGDSQISVEGY